MKCLKSKSRFGKILGELKNNHLVEVEKLEEKIFELSSNNFYLRENDQSQEERIQRLQDEIQILKQGPDTQEREELLAIKHRYYELVKQLEV